MGLELPADVTINRRFNPIAEIDNIRRETWRLDTRVVLLRRATPVSSSRTFGPSAIAWASC